MGILTVRHKEKGHPGVCVLKLPKCTNYQSQTKHLSWENAIFYYKAHVIFQKWLS